MYIVIKQASACTLAQLNSFEKEIHELTLGYRILDCVAYTVFRANCIRFVERKELPFASGTRHTAYLPYNFVITLTDAGEITLTRYLDDGCDDAYGDAYGDDYEAMADSATDTHNPESVNPRKRKAEASDGNYVNRRA